MTPMTTAKFVLAVSGVIMFGIGIRLESTALRWAGTAFVFAALLLRFAKRRPGG
ncbi:MAG TPA: hypothetical protein VHE78_03540 [Gemmatimonadaceae bacterium]|nr:hypothetical protein [Gemmatimonadaceae bacterium]